MGTPQKSLKAAAAAALLAAGVFGPGPASEAAPVHAPGTVLYAGTAAPCDSPTPPR